MKMRNMFLVLIMALSFSVTNVAVMAQLPSSDQIEQFESEKKDSLIVAVNETIQHATGNPDVELEKAPVLDPGNAESLFDYWVWILGLSLPLGLIFLNWIWPSGKRNELVLKTTIAAIVIIIAFVKLNSTGNVNIMTGQALIVFIVKFLSYNNIWKPLGLKSPRKYA